MSDILLNNSNSAWCSVKVGHYFSERRTKVSDIDYPPLSVTYKGVVPQLSHVAKSADTNNRKQVLLGDLVINSRSDRRGASGMAKRDGSVSLINTVLTPQLGNPRFFHHLFRSHAFQEEYYRVGRGIVSDLWTTRYSDLKSIWFAMPEIEDQEKIANFLDKYSEDHDSKELKIRSALRLLKEKEYVAISGRLLSEFNTARDYIDSNLQYLPKIPKNWKLLRAKYLFRQANRVPKAGDEIITAFRDGEVTLRRKRRKTGYTFAEKEVGYQRVLKGDLVIHTMDAFAGAVGVSDETGKATGEYAACIPITEDINPEYYAQLLRYMAYKNYIIILCPSVRERAPRFRFSKFAQVSLPVPPREEQDAIARYVLKSRKLRSLLRKELLLLRERRDAVVSFTVTGMLKDEAKQIKDGLSSNQISTLAAAHIIYSNRHTQRFGRVKLQKTIYLAEAHAGVSELNGQYDREAAGPLDRGQLRRLESDLEAEGYYQISGNLDSGAIRYTPVEDSCSQSQSLQDALGHRADAFFSVVQKLKDMETRSVEAIATLYAVWNDALIDGEILDDDRVVSGVLEEWHPEKKDKFRSDELHTWLGWMRRNDLVPRGQGPRTSTGRLFV